MRNSLEMWTVYDHPRDFPNDYVARKWVVNGDGSYGPDEEVMICSELEPIRERLAASGYACMPRDPNDDATILETWI